ncbi:MAG: AmpG family muropeptide MFS transporter, partial [Aestuariivirgaceae bacterium]
AIDAFRVESLNDNEQAAGLAGYVAAYRIALLVSTAGVVAMAGWLENIGYDGSVIWFWSYAAAASMLIVGMIAVLLAEEPDQPQPSEQLSNANSVTRLAMTAFTAFSDFLAKPEAIAILLFVLLFKFCDAFAGVMTGPFVISIGFEKTAYAGIVKGVGTIAVLAGGFAGGFIARAIPMTTALWIAGILQMSSNLVFSWLASVGVDHTALAIAIVAENLTGGIGTVIFLAYLSALCSSPLHTATQFALLTALASVGRVVLSSYSGFVAEATGWFNFFIVTAVAAIPGLMLLYWLQSRGHFARMTGSKTAGATS